MSSKNDKWSMFRNYTHNELGITKADIREWLKDSIKEEAIKLVHNTYDSFDIKDYIISQLNPGPYRSNDLNRKLIDSITREVMKKIKLNIDIEVDE